MDALIIADDLSGAADCAIGFRLAGHRALVQLHGDPVSVNDHGIGVLAIDADTRRLTLRDAASRTSMLYKQFAQPGTKLYKKIDSTLRGNWAAELAALIPLAGLAVVAPGHPAVGRTVRDGHVHVHGEPLEKTELWKLEHEHRPSGVAAQLQLVGISAEVLRINAAVDQPPGVAARIEALAASGVQALIVDSETEEDLRKLAQGSLLSCCPLFWVGSGGLSQALAQALPTASDTPVSSPGRSNGPTLVLAGSLSAVTERQVAMFDGTSVVQIVVASRVLRARSKGDAWDVIRDRVGNNLARGNDVLLRIGRDDLLDPAQGALLAAALARLVSPHFEMTGGLIATGGETARAMLAEVKIQRLEILSQLETGVILGVPCVSASDHRPWVVTKAGAFGDDMSLHRAWSALRDVH